MKFSEIKDEDDFVVWVWSKPWGKLWGVLVLWLLLYLVVYK